MLVGQLPPAELKRRLAGDGLAVRTGPVSFRLASDAPGIAEFVTLAYADHPVLGERDFCDNPIALRRVGGLRRWLKPQVRVHHDGAPIFEPLPLAHAAPLLEWALNWCVSTHALQFLVIHAATLERDGHALILPAPPGSGKSTLCAALLHRGWRLMSDELTLLSLADGRLHALARPVSLKNRSIDIIQAFEPGAVFSRRTHDTAKGTVALMKPPAEHVRRVAETALPAWLVFPRWVAEAPAQLSPRGKPESLLDLSRQAFNFGAAARQGYQQLLGAIDRCECFDFSYGQLDDAVRTFDGLSGRMAP